MTTRCPAAVATSGYPLYSPCDNVALPLFGDVGIGRSSSSLGASDPCLWPGERNEPVECVSPIVSLESKRSKLTDCGTGIV
eukprot:2984543-Rhodomonas_salina.2